LPSRLTRSGSLRIYELPQARRDEHEFSDSPNRAIGHAALLAFT
jgi:hypothetical protein